MNFYDMTASVPICSLINTMTIDNTLFNTLNLYYKRVNINMSIDCHDYNLSLFLYRNNFNILYYNSKSMGDIFYSDYEQNPMGDYKDTWVNRYSGYYGNFFELLRTFINCNNFNLFKRIFMFFQIIGLFIEFIFPSLSTMVIYIVFNESFACHDLRPASFCTLLYLFILICSGANSLISKTSKKTQISNYIFYFFMEIYYLLILICSIIAIDNVRKNKNHDSYKFNTRTITCIILLTFIPAILPMIIKANNIFDNIIPMLLYLTLGASPSSSSLYIAKILNACDTCGGTKINERKGIIILMFFLINLFFGSLIFLCYNRTKRVETIMIFGISYLVYNFFKTLAIVINLILNKNKLIIPAKNEEEIKNEVFSKNYSLKNSSYNPYKEDFSKNEYQSTNISNQNKTFLKTDVFAQV